MTHNFQLEDALIELTYDCNSSCIICAKAIAPPGPELSFDEWCRVLEELHSLGCARVWFTGGEPMRSGHFWDLLGRARARPWEIVILTNGTLIGEEEVERFVRHPPDWIQPTVFSLDAARHDAITRDPGSHTRTMRAIDLLLRAGLRVRVKVPVVKQNLHCLPAVEAWGRDHDVPVLAAMIVFPRMDGDLSPLAHAVTDPAVIREYLLTRGGRDYNHPPAGEACSDLMPCPGAKSHVAIGPSGTVYPCTPFPLVLDQVRDRSLVAIWKTEPSPATLAVRATHRMDLQRTGSCPVSWCGRCPGLSSHAAQDFRRITGVACAQCAHRDGIGEEFRERAKRASPCG